MKINVCFVTDDGYAIPTCVAMNSIRLLANSKERYDCYVICKNISNKTAEKFKQLENSFFSVKIIELNEGFDFSGYKIEGIPATSTSIFKFFISDILDGLDRVIYLDGDIIVRKSLRELYNENLRTNYIAAVKDVSGLDYGKVGKRFSYFNTGVMLMNLKKMRDDNISSKLLEYRKTGFNRLMDQDAFNYVLKGKALFLPFEYNTQMNALSRVIDYNQNYTLERVKKYWGIVDDYSLSDIFNDAVILHYASVKPWLYYDGYGNDVWLHYFLLSPYSDEKLERVSLYISEIINSTTFRVGRFFMRPVIAIKKATIEKNRKLKEFLDGFTA